MGEPLAVLFEDAHVLAVAKASGVPVQVPPSSSEATLEDAVRRHLRPEDPGSVRLGTVHRLDRPVSGVIVWAKTPKAARRVSEQFARREARKQYWAIVEGRPQADQGLWDDWLTSDTATGVGRTQVCHRATPRARQAITRFRTGRAGRLPEGCSWLRLWPETGRTHQLRVQAAARGLPVLGDHLYGASRPFPLGIALHARSLTFRHPVLGRPLTITAPLPEHWAAHGIALPEADDEADALHPSDLPRPEPQ